jgi:undecaprenyl-diphosphatase
MQSSVARAVLTLAKAEIALVAAVLIGAALLLAFGLLAEEVLAGDTAALDRGLLLALRASGDLADPIGPAWLEEAARDLTALGSTWVLGIIVVTSAGYLFFSGKWHAGLLLVAAVVGGVLLSHALKLGFARPRPDIVPHLARVFTASFPSSHAAVSAAVYLTLGVLLARTVAQSRRTKLYFVGVAVLLTLVIGTTRVYLGLHYPTDVMAGWCIGAAWAMICWAVALYLQRQGGVERPGQTSPPGERPRSGPA